MAEPWMSWEDWHREWSAFAAKQEARDARQLSVLEEMRDSLADVHLRFDGLPCDATKTTLSHLTTDVAALQQRGMVMRFVASKVQPVVKPRLLLGVVGVGAGVLGWDWLARLDAFLRGLAK